DQPAHILRGHRGAVRHVAFSLGGQWLASLDAAGYLRIHTGYPRVGLQRLPGTSPAIDIMPELGVPAPLFAVEVRLTNVNQVTALEVEQDTLMVRRRRQP